MTEIVTSAAVGAKRGQLEMSGAADEEEKAGRNSSLATFEFSNSDKLVCLL